MDPRSVPVGACWDHSWRSERPRRRPPLPAHPHPEALPLFCDPASRAGASSAASAVPCRPLGVTAAPRPRPRSRPWSATGCGLRLIFLTLGTSPASVRPRSRSGLGSAPASLFTALHALGVSPSAASAHGHGARSAPRGDRPPRSERALLFSAPPTHPLHADPRRPGPAIPASLHARRALRRGHSLRSRAPGAAQPRCQRRVEHAGSQGERHARRGRAMRTPGRRKPGRRSARCGQAEGVSSGA